MINMSSFLSIYTEFTSLFKRPRVLPPTKRIKQRAQSSHKNTPLGVCLNCFEKGKKKFTIARYNSSSVTYLIHAHKSENISREQVVSENSPAANPAMKVY